VIKQADRKSLTNCQV